MIAIPDANVLIAVLDKEHIAHAVARSWFEQAVSVGWATCPLTENAVIRVLSNPNYPNLRLSVYDAALILKQLVGRYRATHHFWSDAISLLNSDEVDLSQVRGHNQLTDLYLVALCAANGGQFATLDRGALEWERCLQIQRRVVYLIGAQ